MRHHHVLSVVLLVLATALPAAAQFTQYTEPGNLPIEELPTKQALEQAMADARWEVGKLRVDPWFGLRNVGWVDHVAGQGSDFTATAGVGLHAFTGLGPKGIFTFHALPEYTWWKDAAARRAWNGRYGLGTFGFYNRLRFQVLASSARTASFVSSEFEEPVNITQDRFHGGLEVDLPGRFALFASGEKVNYSYRQQDVSGALGSQLVLLDRSETRVRGGLRYHLSSDFSIGLGAENVNVDFDRSQRDRSSSGNAGLVEMTLTRARLKGRLVALLPSLDPEPGSEFVAYDGALGSFELRWRPAAKLEWELYGYRNLVYSLHQPSPYYGDERTGVAVLFPVGWRGAVRLFTETGRNDYVAAAAGGSTPDRDLTAYGGGVSFELKGKMRLAVYVAQTDYSQPGVANHSVTQIQTSLVIGEQTGEWY